MTSEYHVKRCFAALPVDEVVVADVRDALHAVKIEGMRTTAEESLHVTLKFLGDVEDPHLEDVIEAMERAAEGIGPFELNATGFEYLPDVRRPRVLAVAMDCPAELTELARRMEDAMLEAGFRREGRAYKPHVTVGRFKKPPRHLPLAQEIELAPTGCRIERVQLMQSILRSGGAEYAELASVALRA